MPASIHEVSGGRFQFGIGVTHGPSHVRVGGDAPAARSASSIHISAWPTTSHIRTLERTGSALG